MVEGEDSKLLRKLRPKKVAKKYSSKERTINPFKAHYKKVLSKLLRLYKTKPTAENEEKIKNWGYTFKDHERIRREYAKEKEEAKRAKEIEAEESDRNSKIGERTSAVYHREPKKKKYRSASNQPGVGVD